MSLTAPEAIFIFVVGTTLGMSVICNILVVVVVAVTPMLRNPTNVLLCNLAVSDMLLASVVLPQNLHDISHSDNYFEGDFLCRVVYSCPLVCIMSSIYSMVAMSFDRSNAILLNANRKLTVKTAAIQLAGIWALSVLFSVPTMYEHSEYVIEENENGTILGCGSNGVSYTYSVTNGVVLLMLAYIIPVAILFVNYGRILIFFRTKGMFGEQAESRGVVFKALYRTRVKVVKMLIMVATLFAISWAPYFILLLDEKITGISDTEYAGGAGNLLKIALSAFSTAYNFAVYVAYNSNFRLGMKNLLGCKGRVPCCWGRVAPAGDTDFVATQIAMPHTSSATVS